MRTFVTMKWWFSTSSLISSPFPNYRVVPAAGGDYALSVICKRASAHRVPPAPCSLHLSPSFIGLSTAKLYAEWQNARADFVLFAPTLAFLAAIISFNNHSDLDEFLISRLIRCLNGTTWARRKRDSMIVEDDRRENSYRESNIMKWSVIKQLL